MKRFLLLVLLMMCGMYLVLTMTKGDVINVESSEAESVSGDEGVYSDSDGSGVGA